MNLPELLGMVHSPDSAGAERARAMAELREGLAELARRRLADRSGERHQIPPSQRPDVVQDVLVVLLQMNPVDRILAKDPDRSGEALTASVVAYVSRMLINRYIDTLRRRRTVSYELERHPDESAPSPDQPSVESLVDRIVDVLGQAIDHAIEQRSERNRAGLRRAWKQVLELCLGETSMDEVLARDEGITDESTRQERVAARDRVLTAHRRARLAAREAVDELEASATITADAASQARLALQTVLLRRQKPGGQASVTGGRYD